MGDLPWLLYNQNLVCPGHGLGRELRVRELGVLAGEIRLNYPTGSCASFSDEDWNLELDHFSQCLAKWRPTNRGDAV